MIFSLARMVTSALFLKSSHSTLFAASVWSATAAFTSCCFTTALALASARSSFEDCEQPKNRVIDRSAKRYVTNFALCFIGISFFRFCTNGVDLPIWVPQSRYNFLMIERSCDLVLPSLTLSLPRSSSSFPSMSKRSLSVKWPNFCFSLPATSSHVPLNVSLSMRFSFLLQSDSAIRRD